MASKNQHLWQAEHNEEFLKSIEPLESGKFIDWEVTGLFYAGIHYIEAFLVTKKLESSSHEQRLSNMNSAGLTDDKFQNSYDCLYDWARKTRYKCISIQEYQFELIRQFYNTIKRHILKELHKLTY